MSSNTPRRNSCRGGAGGSRAAPECPPVRRRGSSSCALLSSSSGAQGEENLSVRLSQSLLAITLRLFLAVDLWLSKQLGVCASEESAWGSIRPLVRLVELSGHVLPWLAGSLYTLLRGDSVAEKEIMLNLTLALILDLLTVRAVRTVVRRRRPAQNRADLLSTLFVERCSFPSGHASRAALCARFCAARLVDTASVRVLVVSWAALLGLSQLLLSRHYVTDVGFGLAQGYLQYGLVERLWVTWDCLRDLLLVRVRGSLDRAYSDLWAVAWKLGVGRYG
ncbi:polyisoprenoid diphosphate/phosphate phosphohydrolase PLPP6-like [Cololabis saira]|uniref:polyisoprenoid diphosphate/phosphate phosphohydrolase PLPP6-like n=1 Tax=Cololabis saira TaxID=129043 RepID=UPI002AD3DF31|nr:polyisoprenoid diphosphate/phosphate phosphohydrolase PLPP6-like [Cololabis saira]